MSESIIIGDLWKALITLASAAFSFLLYRSAKKHDDVQKKLDDAEKAIAAHKLHVAENYASKTDVQSSLSRIHDRIDEMSKDIKTLIGGQK